MLNSSRFYLARENSQFAQSLPHGARVLDAGSGSRPYRSLFHHCRYESADLTELNGDDAGTHHACDLASIPVEADRYDAIIFNQTLEHVPDPARVLAELFRVLRPGGRMICTAPFFYEEHSHPLDFYRYTQFGFRHLMDVAGFKIERLDWMEGYFGTVAYQLETAFKYLPSSPSQIAPGIVGLLSAPLITFARGLFWVGAQGFYRLDVRTKYTERGFPKNYVLITYKPQSGLVPADGGT